MRKIVYYVASSIDGYISGPNDDVSAFIYEGDGVQKYLNDLESYDTVIMGKNTYELGYKYGLKPGQPAYPNMSHYIFSNSLTFEQQENSVHVCPRELSEIELIRNQSATDIYLCGGGTFAGWLLDNELIDILKIKLNPIILGQGVRLFGGSQKDFKAELVDSQVYEKGLHIITFNMMY
jgi:dihydrofolate reductase